MTPATRTGLRRTDTDIFAEAEGVVRQVPGVRRVVNRITVAEQPSAEGFEPPEG